MNLDNYHPPYNAEKVAEEMMTSVEHVHEWRTLGLIKGICTGRGWVFPYEAYLEFQRKYTGHDISNMVKAKKAYKEVEDL